MSPGALSRSARLACCFLMMCDLFFVSCVSKPMRRFDENNEANFVKYCDKCIDEGLSTQPPDEMRDKLMMDGANKDAVDHLSGDGSGSGEQEGSGGEDVEGSSGSGSGEDSGEEDDVGEEGEYFEGDIVLGDEYILDPTDYTRNEEEVRNLVLKSGLTWPQKIVYYNFSQEFNEAQRGVVYDAIQDIHNISCVKFLPRTSESTYLYFRNKKKSCSAPVGWNPRRGRIDVSLGGRNCLRKRGTVQHELLHALGFWHEHSRTDRDRNIVVQWDNIQEGREKNFRVRMANESTTLGIPYDFASVMHYKNNSFSRDKKRKPTILPRDPKMKIFMGQRIRISPSDIAKLNRLYRCDRTKYEMGNNIPGAVDWDTFRETVLNESPIYFNKLPAPEPLEFEENHVLIFGKRP